MSDFRVSQRSAYQITPGCKALYELIDRYEPEVVHMKLLEVQNTLGHLYIEFRDKELLHQIAFIKELDEAVKKCRLS